MATPGQGISVGDAVLSFLGDTTNLDAAYDKVAAGADKALKPAAAQFDSLTEKIKVQEEEIQQLGTELSELQNKFDSLGQHGSSSMLRTTEATRTVEEAIGVRLPRGVTSFISRLPGVASAMELAFDASIVFFLLDAVVKATEALTSFSSGALKADEDTAKINATIGSLNDRLQQARLAFEDVGASAKEKLAASVENLNDVTSKGIDGLTSLQREADKTKQVLDKSLKMEALGKGSFLEKAEATSLAAQELINTTKGIPPTFKSVAAATADYNEALTKLTAGQTQYQAAVTEAATKVKQAQLDELNTSISTANARIAADQTEKTARLSLQIQLDRQRVLSSGGSESQLALIVKKGEDELYQIELSADQNRLAQLQRNSVQNKDEIIKLHADIEKLTDDFKAKQLKSFNDIEEGIEKLSSVGADRVKQFALGIQGFGKATDAVDGLSKSLYQVGTAMEILHIREDDGVKSLNAQAAAVKKLEEEQNKDKVSTQALAAAKLKLALQYVNVSKYGMIEKAVMDSTASAITSAAQAFGEGSVTIGQAFRQIAAAEIESIAQVAAIQGTKQLAEGFAAMTINGATEFGPPGPHFLSAAEWFAAAAIAGAAGGLVGGGSSSSSGGGSSSVAGSPISTSPAAQNQQQPTQTVNIQHLAGGGLISHHTLAMIGDSPSGGNAREAVLPLDNPKAMKAIADALAPHIAANGGGTVVHNHNYPKGLMMGTAKEVTRHISKAVEKGTARLHSSSTGRVIRKS